MDKLPNHRLVIAASVDYLQAVGFKDVADTLPPEQSLSFYKIFAAYVGYAIFNDQQNNQPGEYRIAHVCGEWQDDRQYFQLALTR